MQLKKKNHVSRNKECEESYREGDHILESRVSEKGVGILRRTSVTVNFYSMVKWSYMSLGFPNREGSSSFCISISNCKEKC